MRSIHFLRGNKNQLSRKFGILTPEGQPKKKANVDEWMSTVQSKATTTEGKSYTLQLTSLINYYNRKFEESDKSKINWEEWDQKIQTKGIVEKIKNNVESLTKEKYSKQPLIEKVRNSVSPQEASINNELFYHITLWSAFYTVNMQQHTSLKFIPRLSDLGTVEKCDIFPGQCTEGQRAQETFNMTPWSFDDLPVVNYAFNQFRWGKRMATFMRHPNDDYRSVKGTRTIMGR